ncbi:uncharacterized protein LOC142357242 [Convolutriloba macropyga]|uniref:uncharacterized protein LOC142357242 n=1 Tax=Convolutriloba macropyga TaxID=536237 RepID=UPI003F5253DA
MIVLIVWSVVSVYSIFYDYYWECRDIKSILVMVVILASIAITAQIIVFVIKAVHISRRKAMNRINSMKMRNQTELGSYEQTSFNDHTSIITNAQCANYVELP